MGRRSNAYLVEVDACGLRWAKASMSGGGGAACLELATADGLVLVRDSRDRSGPRLSFPALNWEDFLTTLSPV